MSMPSSEKIRLRIRNDGDEVFRILRTDEITGKAIHFILNPHEDVEAVLHRDDFEAFLKMVLKHMTPETRATYDDLKVAVEAAP